MPATPSDFISPDSLNWALTHVLRYGEGDIFPRAFEFEAYKTQWPEVLAHLSKIDLSSHEVGCSLKLLVPKGKWGSGWPARRTARAVCNCCRAPCRPSPAWLPTAPIASWAVRSEEHTSELQSLRHL